MATKKAKAKSSYKKVDKETQKFFRAKAPIELHKLAKLEAVNSGVSFEQVTLDLIADGLKSRGVKYKAV